jgi:hypothetical protein
MRFLFPTLLAALTLSSAALAQSPPAAQTIPPEWAPEAIESNLARSMEDVTVRQAFLTSLLNGQVWVRVDQATVDAAAEQLRTRQGRVQTRIFTGKIEGGDEVIFAFTRPELAVLAFGEDVPLLGMSGEMAFRLQTQFGLSLNYNNGPGVIFTPDDIAALLAGLTHAPREPAAP